MLSQGNQDLFHFGENVDNLLIKFVVFKQEVRDNNDRHTICNDKVNEVFQFLHPLFRVELRCVVTERGWVECYFCFNRSLYTFGVMGVNHVIMCREKEVTIFAGYGTP